MRRIKGSIACAVAAIALSSCVFENWHTDLGDFVERGLSLTKLVSFTYAQEGVAVNGDVAHGTPVTVSMKILNPKEIDLAYELICDSTLVESGSLSAVSESGISDGYTTASFSFIPTALAEHGDVTFGLAMRSPSINKRFEQGTITLRCDCAPSPVASIVAGPRADGRACVGFTLPDGYENSDVVSARIDYSSATTGTTKSVTETVSRDGTGLTATPDPVLLDAAPDSFPRYFIPDDVVAGNPYSFTVVLIDASGKESAPSSASVAGNEVTLAFDANGGTGTVGARFGFNGSTVAIPGGATLKKEGASFAGWNAARDGSGAWYNPGANYTFTNASQTLYAQWTQLGDITVKVTSPTYHKLGFSRAGHAITTAYVDVNGILSLSFATGADAYRWYVDGADTGNTNAVYSFNPENLLLTFGTHIVSATANIGGVLYSGDLAVTVTDDYMITILPEGQIATFTQTSFTDPGPVGTTQSFTHTLTQPYQLARYEVSYRLWMLIFTWAKENGYQFSNEAVGARGRGNAVNTNVEHPVTEESDLDAMIWCNAYSEMTGATPCYYLDEDHDRIARSYDDMADLVSVYSKRYVRWDVNGYRLPTRGEWYYAASCGGLYEYDHVSGCPEDYSKAASFLYANILTNTTIGPNDRLPNAWGLYNMSGNVWEFSFDQFSTTGPMDESVTDYICEFGDSGDMRIANGSSCWDNHDRQKAAIGFKAPAAIGSGFDDDGFRLARSIE